VRGTLHIGISNLTTSSIVRVTLKMSTSSFQILVHPRR
jgi:hypothetical protein